MSNWTLWLAADPVNAVAFYRTEFAWRRTERLAALRPPRNVQGARSKLRSILARSAALVAIAALGVGVYLGIKDPGTQTYATTIGSRKTLSLPDGSQIELNTSTILRMSKADNRRVWLDRGKRISRSFTIPNILLQWISVRAA